jgi:hypothetical protein
VQAASPGSKGIFMKMELNQALGLKAGAIGLGTFSPAERFNNDQLYEQPRRRHRRGGSP